MIPHWKHFTFEQRKTIANMVARKYKLKDIAVALGVDPTSVSKEVFCKIFGDAALKSLLSA